jgi:Tfp pilus assembly protein PilF
MAQGNGPVLPGLGNNSNDVVQAIWVVAGKVKTVHHEPVQGATVMVTPLVPAGIRTLTTNAQGEFRTQYQLNSVEFSGFSAILTVKKKGFQTAHAFVDYGNSVRTREVPVTLREPDEDPALLSPADLISSLAPKLRKLGPADGLAAKSENDYTEGVEDFFDQHNCERAVPLLSRVLEYNPSCIGCRTMLALAELGWGDWDDAYQTLAEGVHATLANPRTGRTEQLVAYGTWVSWQHEPEKAEPFFLEALKSAPQDAMALQELGRALVSTRNYEAANDVLKRALAVGAGPAAQLLDFEALVGAGHYDEAALEMNRYLDGRDVKKMPAGVRQVWASFPHRGKVEPPTAKTQAKVEPRTAKIQSPEGPEPAPLPPRSPVDLLQGLEPAKDQEQLSSILDGVGTKILELIKNFPNTSSLEVIHQEKVSHRGGGGSQDQKFRYLCLASSEASGPSFLEYRTDFAGNEARPEGLSEGFMLTTGFTSAALIFHPEYRAESTFQYLGRQKVNGRNAYVVAFAQIPGKAHFTGNFRQGSTSGTMFSQGVAWIDTATYQIIRLHTDLLAPLPELRLEKETVNIDFNEVQFRSLKGPLWLPENVTVAIDWNGKQLRNQHEYSDFKIFQVDTSQKMGKPKNSRESSKQTQEPTVSQ